MTAPRSPDTPFLGQGSDEFRPGDRVNVPRGNDALSRQVSNALTAMTASGVDAERLYQRSLWALDRNPDSIEAIAGHYRELDDDQYLERWSAVQLITDLRSGEALDFLADVLRAPMPAESSGDPAHGFSTVAEEVIIRTTAIEALGRRLAGGETTAGELLIEQLGSDVMSIRRAAVQAATDSGDQALVRRVRETVSGTENEWMLSIHRASVGSVPQPDPRLTLRERPSTDSAIPPAPVD